MPMIEKLVLNPPNTFGVLKICLTIYDIFIYNLHSLLSRALQFHDRVLLIELFIFNLFT